MENQNTEKKTNWKLIILISTLAIIAYGIICWVLIGSLKESKEVNEKLTKEAVLNATCNHKTDSLLKRVKSLSKYEVVSDAMVHRDEATKSLIYKVGDQVHLKRDSARVTIDDIIIGGSKYEYYVRYRVLHNDKTVEEVKPELVY
ncbi:MAG: hypothetical protein E6Q36_05575 [Chryseobacterium sp.]|nr:MAG: hypothetical protein E6Q36_05575 [Chryseobacterium sp.]